MTLMLKAKGVVTFEWSDEDTETVVRIEPADDQATIVRKLKRVIALVEPSSPARIPGRTHEAPIVMDDPYAGMNDPRPGNGWAPYSPAGLQEAPEVPERLQGEVELIPEGERE